ncbi:opine dehydrogenase [Haliotis rubra]|uniref:opine dehydrogenase n=1 Tax=Haliotis rubra TaxID=36100 RepID=UPI001EE5BD33|nr:opine dehydrogenase [Haliotis rubra]XP_046566962.1 opine dehydrogenase [Haliotis rubra]
MTKKLTVLVCGGGNGAHVTAGLAASRDDIETRVLTTFADEAERWTNIMKENDLRITVDEGDIKSGDPVDFKVKLNCITKDPSKAVPGADVIIFTVPAFAHQSYLEAIEPYIQPNTTIVGMPGQPGFEFQVFDVLKDKAKQCVIMSFESLPWACRIAEFGKFVQILMVKVNLMGCIIRGQSKPSYEPLEAVQKVMGKAPILTQANNYIEPILATKSIIHPPIMYGKWKDWDGKPLDQKPLFYQGLDEGEARYLGGISDELVATAKAIATQKPEVDLSGVLHLYDWYLRDHKPYIKDTTNLLTVMQTDTAYDGLVHPMKETEDGKFVPDFRYRYLTEDVPNGLVVTKGLAQIAGVPTPYHDEVITWCQKQLGKEIIVGDKLTGKDIGSTRCPQRYGINTIDALVSIM